MSKATSFDAYAQNNLATFTAVEAQKPAAGSFLFRKLAQPLCIPVPELKHRNFARALTRNRTAQPGRGDPPDGS